MEKISATPWMVREKARVNVHFTEPAETKEEPKIHEMLPMPKKFQIDLSDLDEFGYTADCPSCKFVRVFRKTKRGLHHSDQCRQRLLEAIMGTEKGRMRLENMKSASTKL